MEVASHASNASGSIEEASPADNTTSHGEVTGGESTGHASNMSGSGEDSSYATIVGNANGFAAVTGQVSRTNE